MTPSTDTSRIDPAATPPDDARTRRTGPVRRTARFLAICFGWLGIVGATGWMGLAVYYSDRHSAPPRLWTALLVTAGSLAAAILIKPRRRGVVVFLLAFSGTIAWFLTLRPSSSLDWAADVARMPTATVDGNLVRIRNVRNFQYRSETDFTPVYEDRTYDLSKLRSLDYVLSYWSGRAIAHAFVSFGFEDGSYVAVSIETRKEKSESYSAVEGFFRQYELIYVVADERDLIGLRAAHRGEDVYLFRLRTPISKVRAVFLDYVHTVNSLNERPQFYNALTANCTTSILTHLRRVPPYPPFSMKVLISGYSSQFAYESGALDPSLTFDELQARGRVTDRAKAAMDDANFSARIREGVPMPPPMDPPPAD
ncbi:hypothetical protein RAS2_09040 [Phycisphaerae bacterium RAS2]|nr:hypothetical protein RAS2_09040 [Phycisphaerae bacterium RAS2]